MSAFVVDSTSSLLDLIGICALIGGLAGLVASLAKAPSSRTKAEFGGYNRLRFPSCYKNKDQTRTMGIDLGSVGPIIVGAGGAIVLVFFTGLTAADSAEQGEMVISYTQLVALSIAGGAAGQLIFRSLAEGKKIAFDSATQAVANAAKQGKKAAKGTSSTPDKVEAEALRAGMASLKE